MSPQTSNRLFLSATLAAAAFLVLSPRVRADDVPTGKSTAPAPNPIAKRKSIDLVLCLDTSGKALWSAANDFTGVALDHLPKRPQFAEECGFAASTPLTDGRHVWACYGTGIVACYDTAGKRAWVRYVEQPVNTQYGRSVSPLLTDGKLIVGVGVVTALNPVTGEELWRSTSKVSYGTPAPAKIGDTPVLICPSGEVVRLADGKVLAKKIALAKYSSPVIDGDVVYFASSPVVALKIPAALEEPLKFARVWKNDDLDGDIFTSPLIADGRLYCGNADGQLFVIDARTGTTLYDKKLDIAAGGSGKATLYPSPTLVGKNVLLGDNGGHCLVIASAADYQQLARNTLPKGSGASPIAAGKLLLLRGGANLYAIGVK